MTNTFEYILLKKLIVSGEFFNKIMPILETKHFQSIGNQQLFKLIKTYYTDYRSIPTPTELIALVKNVPNEEIRTTIIEELQKINSTEEVQNLDFMIDETIKFIKDSVFLEALILGSDGIQEKNDEKKIKAKALMEEMSKISVDSDLGLDFDDIEEMIKYYQERLLGIRTQHDEFNKRIGAGFLPQTLSVIMAASGVGKSLLMTDLISGHIKDGKNVLLVSMEMMDKEIMKRVHANALDLEINTLRTISPDVIRQAHRQLTSESIGKFYVKDYPNGSFSALMLEQLLESYKIEKGIEFDIVYLDYLGIMKSDLVSPSAGLYSYVKSIVEEVRAVAKKFDIPIVSASQLNRQAVNNTEASNDAVSDSIGTVQTADFIVFLLQNEQMKEEKLVTAKCTKNRFTGRTDTWDMNVDYEHMRFSDTQKIGMSDAEVMTTIGEQVGQDISIIKKHDDDFGDIDTTKEVPKEDDIMAQLGL